MEIRNMLLTNRKLLVTGAQQGIGKAIALAAARAGADVAVNYLDDEPAALRVCDEIAAMGRLAVCVQGDVSDVSKSRELVERASSGLDGLNLLVNNAGIFRTTPFLELTEETWDKTIAVNLKGVCFLSQAFARYFQSAHETSGVIISIASIVVQGWPEAAHYAASKGGLVSLTRTLAMELREMGIRANAVSPGLTDTAQPRGNWSEDVIAQMAKSSGAGRVASAEEIAEVVVFLLSSSARHINGQNIHVNGGALMA